MRSRSISIYSQDDFEKQILSYKKENSNVQIIRPQSNSVVSYSEEINKEVDETNSEEDLIKMLTSLNKSYKINNNLNQSELNPTTLSIITKCLKDIIQSKNSLLFNRDKRIKSFDINDKTKRIKFRNLIHCVKSSSKKNDLINKNLQSLSFLNIMLISNFEHLKFNFFNDLDDNKFSYEKKNNCPLTIFSKQLNINNHLLTIKIFDIDYNLQLFSVYKSISHVIILCFSGDFFNQMFNLLQQINGGNQMLSIIEINPINSTIKKYCEANNLFYHESNDLSTTVDDHKFQKYLYKLNYIMKYQDYIEQTENNREENEEEFDCLQQGMKYNLTIEYNKEVLPQKKPSKLLLTNKKLSVDSYIDT